MPRTNVKRCGDPTNRRLRALLLVVSLGWACASPDTPAPAQTPAQTAAQMPTSADTFARVSKRVDPWVAKPRVVVMTDIANEPDDQMSMVRLLVYSNQFDIEGLVATTSTWMRARVRPDVIHPAMKTTVSSKGQVVLPAEIRRMDRIEAGQEFDVERLDRGDYRLVRRTARRNDGVVDWLLSCPDKGFFVPVEFESTDTL